MFTAAQVNISHLNTIQHTTRMYIIRLIVITG